MSILGDVFAGGISGIADGVVKIVNLINGKDPEAAKQQAEILIQQLKQAQELDLAQIEVNKLEAQNSNLFVSGWRPFVGWVCAFAFAYHYILQPFLVFLMAACGYTFALPAFSMEALITVLFGLLGLSGMRSYEKVKGVSK